MDKVIPVL